MIIQNIVVGTLQIILSLLIYPLYNFFHINKHPFSTTNLILPQGFPSSLSRYLLHRHTLLQYRNSQLPFMIYQIFTFSIFILGLLMAQQLRIWPIIFGILLVLIAELLQTQVLNKGMYIVIRLLISSTSVIMILLCGVYMITSHYRSGLITVYSLLIMWFGDQFIIRPLCFLLIYIVISILNYFFPRKIQRSSLLSYAEQQEQYRKFLNKETKCKRLGKGEITQYIGNKKHIQIDNYLSRNKLNNSKEKMNEGSQDFVMVEDLQKLEQIMQDQFKKHRNKTSSIVEEEDDQSSKKKINVYNSFDSSHQNKLKQSKQFIKNGIYSSNRQDNNSEEQNKTDGITIRYKSKINYEQQSRKQSHSSCSQTVEIKKYKNNKKHLLGIYQQSKEYVQDIENQKKQSKKYKQKRKKRNMNDLLTGPSPYLENLENLVKPEEEQKRRRKLTLNGEDYRKKFNKPRELKQLQVLVYENEKKIHTFQQNYL